MLWEFSLIFTVREGKISVIINHCECSGNDFMDWLMMKQRLDTLWQEFHLPIWVTEFDWNADETADFGDHSLHAEILENFYRLMFSHPAVAGILSWRTNTLEADNTPNKAGQAYINLYHQEWRSDQVLRPAQSNTAAFRGFRGGYEVRIKRGDQVLAEMEFTLEGDRTFDCVADIILETIICQ